MRHRADRSTVPGPVTDSDLADFERASFTHEGQTRTIFRTGSGPAVIVIAEMPGISPKVIEFARTGRRDRLHGGAPPPLR